jgi:hypothetical protein
VVAGSVDNHSMNLIATFRLLTLESSVNIFLNVEYSSSSKFSLKGAGSSGAVLSRAFVY